MDEMKRREFFKRTGAGAGAALIIATSEADRIHLPELAFKDFQHEMLPQFTKMVRESNIFTFCQVAPGQAFHLAPTEAGYRKIIARIEPIEYRGTGITVTIEGDTR
jgi:hypothetical protein